MKQNYCLESLNLTGLYALTNRDLDMADLPSPIDQLLNRVEITRQARFTAKNRLQRRHKRSYYLVSMMSLFVILLSLIPNIFPVTSQQSQVLLAITIVNSVFIIVTTLMDSAGEYLLQSHLMQNSARRLSELFNELSVHKDDISKERLKNPPFSA